MLCKPVDYLSAHVNDELKEHEIDISGTKQMLTLNNHMLSQASAEGPALGLYRIMQFRKKFNY